MDFELSEIIIEILDEIIEACHNNLTPIRDNESEQTSDNEYKCADQSDAAARDHVELVEEDAQGGTEPAKGVKKSVDADRTMLKNFSMRNFLRKSVTQNLACDINVSKYELRCEGFPSNMMEEELVLMFAKCGEVYKLEKLFEVQQVFVTFTKAADAERAIRTWHGRTIQGRQVQLFKQLPNRRLIVRGIPKCMTKTELFRKFTALTRHLVSVLVFNDAYDESLNRGFCYLEYPEHYLAVEAMAVLSTVQPFRSYSIVEWPDRLFEWMETPDRLFISNVRTSLNTHEIKDIFSVFGRVVRVTRTVNFACVQFQRVVDAKRATNEVDRSLLGNENVDISSVKLMDKNEHFHCLENAKRAVNDGDKSGNKSDRFPSDKVMQSKQPNNDSISDTLYINNLTATVSAADLRQIFSLYGSALVIELDRNMGWASVQFPNQDQAKRTASDIDKGRLGRDVRISFFNDTVDKASDTLYISNLRSNITTSDLRKCFTVYGEIMDVDFNKDSAIIRFSDPQKAKTAAQYVDRQCLGDRVQISSVKKTEIDDKPAETSEEKKKKRRGKSSENKGEKKQSDTSDDKVEKKRTKKSGENNNIEKKRLLTSNTLHIYKMYADMSTRKLRELFEVYGYVADIDIAIDVDLYKKCGFVRFRNEEDAVRAAHEIDRIHLGPPVDQVEILFFPKNL